ncbi:MAG: glycoside hydrolase family 13 [Verrucomicrobia bacterium]|nr:glycoside hydrolase family 13 [Verrucomicrobiota bacterium]
MNFENPFEPVGRVEKKSTKSTKSVNFFYLDGKASKVSVVGDFNAWDKEANRMQRRIDGSWQTTIELPNGHHRYMLNVDGNLVEDPKAHGIVRNEQGARVCMIAVSGF